jgi:hypothetical protein
MTDEQWRQFYEVYEFMCEGRIFMARERLEILLGIENKDTA